SVRERLARPPLPSSAHPSGGRLAVRGQAVDRGTDAAPSLQPVPLVAPRQHRAAVPPDTLVPVPAGQPDRLVTQRRSDRRAGGRCGSVPPARGPPTPGVRPAGNPGAAAGTAAG